MVNNLCKLGSKRSGGGEFLTNEIAGCDVRDTKEGGEARGVGAFTDARAAEEDPLNIGVSLGVFTKRERWPLKKRGRGGGVGFERSFGNDR